MKRFITIANKIPEKVINTYHLESHRDKKVVMYKDRYLHIAKHKHEFKSDKHYKNSLLAIPRIICSPDYVFCNHRHNSIEFYKKIDQDTCVVVRVGNNLKVKSMFPVTQEKINNRKKQQLL